MQDVDYLERNYPGQSHHARLLNDFTGKSKTKLASEGFFYVGLGFSYQERELYRFILIYIDYNYLTWIIELSASIKTNVSIQARDSRTRAHFCDFKDNSGTFNSETINIPGQGLIKSFANKAGDTRTTEVVGMIKLAVNHWRATDERVLQVSKIRSWMNDNNLIKSIIPPCPPGTYQIP